MIHQSVIVLKWKSAEFISRQLVYSSGVEGKLEVWWVEGGGGEGWRDGSEGCVGEVLGVDEVVAHGQVRLLVSGLLCSQRRLLLMNSKYSASASSFVIGFARSYSFKNFGRSSS